MSITAAIKSIDDLSVKLQDNGSEELKRLNPQQGAARMSILKRSSSRRKATRIQKRSVSTAPASRVA